MQDLDRTCFVIMPFGNQEDGTYDDFMAVYKELIEKAIDDSMLNLIVMRADEINKSGSIIKDIVEYIQGSAIVIADLTGLNANVFYELGVRHALTGRSILITQKIDEVPFDLRGNRIIEYQPTLKGGRRFKGLLVEYLKNIINNPKSSDNPVKNYLRGDSKQDLESENNKLRLEVERLNNKLERYKGNWPMPTDLPVHRQVSARERVQKIQKTLNEKIVIVDDDPGGMHCLSDVPFIINLDNHDLLVDAVNNEQSDVLFMVTDSRSHLPEDAVEINTKIGKLLGSIQASSKRAITVISRGDSTLRGHYPSESDALKNEFENKASVKFKAEIFCPAYIETGRITWNNTHWMKHGNELSPVGLTEYANDPTFTYSESNLENWMRSRIAGMEENVYQFVTLKDIRQENGAHFIKDLIINTKQYTRYITEAVDNLDLDIIAEGVCLAEKAGHRVFHRAAPSYLRARMGRKIEEAKIEINQVIHEKLNGPGLIIIGSITELSNLQKECAEKIEKVASFELNAKKLYTPAVHNSELLRITKSAMEMLLSGSDVIISTSEYHQKGDEPPSASKGRVLFALAKLAENLFPRVGYIIAKGSDTAFQIMQESYKMESGIYLGTVMTGIGVCYPEKGSNDLQVPLFLAQGNSGDVDNIARLISIMRSFR